MHDDLTRDIERLVEFALCARDPAQQAEARRQARTLEQRIAAAMRTQFESGIEVGRSSGGK